MSFGQTDMIQATAGSMQSAKQKVRKGLPSMTADTFATAMGNFRLCCIDIRYLQSAHSHELCILCLLLVDAL